MIFRSGRIEQFSDIIGQLPVDVQVTNLLPIDEARKIRVDPVNHRHHFDVVIAEEIAVRIIVASRTFDCFSRGTDSSLRDVGRSGLNAFRGPTLFVPAAGRSFEVNIDGPLLGYCEQFLMSDHRVLVCARDGPDRRRGRLSPHRAGDREHGDDFRRVQTSTARRIQRIQAALVAGIHSREVRPITDRVGGGEI